MSPCFRPVTAFRAPGGGVAFDTKAGFSDLPLELPCGKCIGCKQSKARQWTIRCVHEAAMHDHNTFVTLTYDQEHVPADGALRKSDLSAFWDRLRYAKGRFRYFACGEYGPRTLRPHYHALLFGVHFEDARWESRDRRRVRVSDQLAGLWENGSTELGEVGRASAAYCAQYCVKKTHNGDDDSRYDRRTLDGRKFRVPPEFITMSRRPGLGSAWMERYGASDVEPHDQVILDGAGYKIPRFYLERLAPEKQKDYKARQVRRARKIGDRHRTPRRLRERENVAEARHRLFSDSKSGL